MNSQPTHPSEVKQHRSTFGAMYQRMHAKPRSNHRSFQRERTYLIGQYVDFALDRMI